MSKISATNKRSLSYKVTDTSVSQRTVSFGIVANAGKLDKLHDAMDAAQLATDYALHLYKTYIGVGFDQTDVERVVDLRLRQRFSRALYSKTLQKINKYVVSSTISHSVSKLMRTRYIDAVCIYDKQMFDLQLVDNRFRYWLNLRGLRQQDSLKFHRCNVALVGAKSSTDIKNALSVDEVRLIRRTKSITHKRRPPIIKRWLVIHAVITETNVHALALDTASKVVGIDQNYGNLMMTDGTTDSVIDMSAYTRRSEAHRRNVREFNNFGKDFIEKMTTELANKFFYDFVEVVIFEDLKTLRHSARRANCSRGRRCRHMLNNGFPSGQFQRRLIWKLKKRGITCRIVDPSYTSQGCSCCGYTHVKNRPNVEGFSCGWCGHAEHSGLNAARNIRLRGLATLFNTPDIDLVRHIGSALRTSDKKFEENYYSCNTEEDPISRATALETRAV